MNASDMLDVIHFLFEDDITSVQSKEHADAKEKIRLTIYRELYSQEYKYIGGSTPQDVMDPAILEEELGIEPVSSDAFKPAADRAMALPPKPYVPATPVNAQLVKPFGASVDAPLG